MHIIYLALAIPVIFVCTPFLKNDENPSKEPIAHTRSPVAYHIEALQRAQSAAQTATVAYVEVEEMEIMEVAACSPSDAAPAETGVWTFQSPGAPAFSWSDTPEKDALLSCEDDLPEKYLCLAQDLWKNLGYTWNRKADRMVLKSSCPPHDETYYWLWRCWKQHPDPLK